MNSVEQKVFESMCKYADLFIKESANMTDLRRAYKAVVKPKVIHRALAPSGSLASKKSTLGLLSLNHRAASPQQAEFIRSLAPDVNDRLLRLPSAIYSGRRGAFGALGEAQRQLGEFGVQIPNIPSHKPSREAIGRITGLHEGFEQSVRPKNFALMATHLSPKVLFQESNLVASLPRELAPAKRYFRQLRDASGESQFLRDRLSQPGVPFRYGSRRLSRREMNLGVKKYQKEYGQEQKLSRLSTMDLAKQQLAAQ